MKRRAQFAVRLNLCEVHPFSACPADCVGFNLAKFQAHVLMYLATQYKFAVRVEPVFAPAIKAAYTLAQKRMGA